MKYLYILSLVLLFGCVGAYKESPQIVNNDAHILTELNKYLQQDFDEYDRSGWKYLAKGNMDSALYYAGKMQANQEFSRHIKEIFTPLVKKQTQ